MSQHQDNIFKSMKDVRFEGTISHQCGVTMNDSVEARVIAEVMADKEGTTVTYMPAMIRIDGNGKILFHAVYSGIKYSQARQKLLKDSGLKDLVAANGKAKK